MGKLSNMMYMIDLLNTGNIYTLKELSEKIGVTERMIRYYKNEICANGIAIESFKGPNGGYFMIDKIKNYTSINKYDIQLLENKYIANINISAPGEIEKLIENAINKNDKIEIIYNDIDGGQSKRVIHPLHLFKYKDNYYVTAFCELRNDIRHFELKRIVNIK